MASSKESSKEELRAARREVDAAREEASRMQVHLNVYQMLFVQMLFYLDKYDKYDRFIPDAV